MAKIPIILEPGRADGKLATSDAIFDENKGMFQSEINDIQDTLNSDNTNKPLSAKQGKVLKELLDAKVIETGAVPIDSEPIEGNTTHVVNSDGIYKALEKKVNNVTFEERNKNQDKKLSELENKIKGYEDFVNIESTYQTNSYVDDNGRIQNYDTLGLARYPIEKDKTYKINVEQSTNSAGWELAYASTLSTNPASPITDAGKGNKGVFSYTYIATQDGILLVGYMSGTPLPVVKEVFKTGGLEDKVKNLSTKIDEIKKEVGGFDGRIKSLDKQINGSEVLVDVVGEELKINSYVTTNKRVDIYANNNLAIAPFRVLANKTYIIHTDKTCNAAGYVLCYADSLASVDVEPIIETMGNRGVFDYTYNADKDGYIYIGISTDSPSTTVKVIEKGDSIIKDIKELKKKSGAIDWSSKKWFVIGDSLSTLNSTTTKRYIDYIVEKTGINAVVRAVGGSSWGQPQLNNNAFYQQALDVPEDADVVTFFGSFNSWEKREGGVVTDGPTSGKGNIDDSGTDTYYGCVNTAFSNLFSVNHLVRVGVIFPTPWLTSNPYNANTQTAQTLIEVLENASKRWGIPILDLYHCSGMRPWDLTYRQRVYSKDSGGIDGNPAGVHPNEIGHEIIATYVLEFMKTLIL